MSIIDRLNYNEDDDLEKIKQDIREKNKLQEKMDSGETFMMSSKKAEDLNFNRDKPVGEHIVDNFVDGFGKVKRGLNFQSSTEKKLEKNDEHGHTDGLTGLQGAYKNTVAGFSSLYGIGEMALSPITGVVANLAEGGNGGASRLIDFINKVEDFGGRQLAKLDRKILGEHITPEYKEISSYVGGNIALSGGGAIAGAFIKPAIKGVGKGVSQLNKFGGTALDKIGFNKFDAETDFKNLQETFDVFEGGLKDVSGNFEKQGENIRKILQDLNNGGSTSIAKAKLKKLNIKSDEIIEKVEKAFSPNGISNKNISSLLHPFKGKPTKAIKNFKKILAEKGYNFKKISSDKGNQKILSSIKGIKNQGKMVNYIDGEFINNKSIGERAFYSLLEAQQMKAVNGVDISPEITLAKSNALQVAEEFGLVKRIEDVYNPNNWSFKLTKRGERLLKKMDVSEFSSTRGSGNQQIFKDSLIENGIAHIPKNKYIVSGKGKGITGDEINFIVDDTLSKNEIKNIRDLGMKAKLGEEITEEELSSYKESVRHLQQRKGLKNIDEEDFKDLDKLSDKIEAQIREGFITENSIKNVGKNNIEGQIRWVKNLSAISLKKIDGYAGKINKLKQVLKSDKEKIIKKFKHNHLQVKASLNALDNKYKQQLLEARYQQEGIAGAKDMIKNELYKLGKSSNYGGDVKKIIGEITSKKYWDEISSLDDIDNVIMKVNKKIEVEAMRDKMNKLEKALTLPKKNNDISVEHYNLILTIKEQFNKMKKGELDFGEVDQILEMVENLKATGKNKKLNYNKIFGLNISDNIEEISKNIKEEHLRVINDKTLSGKVKNIWGIYRQSTRFSPRVIRDIFNGNELAQEIFIGNIKRQYNYFERFETEVTDQMAKFVLNTFDKSPAKMQEFYDYLLMRRRIPTDEGTEYWMGYEYLLKDGDNSLKVKATREIGMDELPDSFKTMPSEIWDKVRKTKLGELIIDMEAPKYQKAIKAVDDYHRITGKLYNNMQVKADNTFTKPEEFYIAVNNLAGKEHLMDLGDSFSRNGYINKNRMKAVQQSIKGLKDVELDRDFLSIIYGAEKSTRYYAHMQEVFMLAKRTYEGISTSVKDVKVSELNDYAVKDDYFLTYKGKKIELEEDVLNGKREVRAIIEEDRDVFNKEVGKFETQTVSDVISVPVDKIRVRQRNSGLAGQLNREANRQMKAFLDRVARGGSEFAGRGDHLVSTVANHFNRIPLMGSISVVLKQPLSMIDALGRIGPNHFYSAVKDMMVDKELRKALLKVPAIKNRGGGDYLIKEGKRHTIGAGWVDSIGNNYQKFVDVMMEPLKIADQIVYTTIALAGFRKKMIKSGIIDSSDRITGKMLKEFVIKNVKQSDGISKRIDTQKLLDDALTDADLIASTAHPLMMPKVYDKPFQKALFGIFTTQLNRIQQAMDDIPYAWKKGEKQQAVMMGAMLATSNIMEVAITMAVGKYILLPLNATNWDGYNEDFASLMISGNSISRMTVGQFFIPSKISGLLNPEFGLAPAIGGLNKLAKHGAGTIDAGLEGDFQKMIEEAGKTFTVGVGGKLTEQSWNSFVNSMNK